MLRLISSEVFSETARGDDLVFFVMAADTDKPQPSVFRLRAMGDEPYAKWVFANLHEESAEGDERERWPLHVPTEQIGANGLAEFMRAHFLNQERPHAIDDLAPFLTFIKSADAEA